MSPLGKDKQLKAEFGSYTHSSAQPEKPSGWRWEPCKHLAPWQQRLPGAPLEAKLGIIGAGYSIDAAGAWTCIPPGVQMSADRNVRPHLGIRAVVQGVRLLSSSREEGGALGPATGLSCPWVLWFRGRG